MQIKMTNEGSAKLLGIDPACYTDETLKRLATESAKHAAEMERHDEDSNEYCDAFYFKCQADRSFDERYDELNRGRS